jgi:hypothetical protein
MIAGRTVMVSESEPISQAMGIHRARLTNRSRSQRVAYSDYVRFFAYAQNDKR